MPNRKYNRKVPKPLPAKMMLRRVNIPVKHVDLRSWCGPIKDQGDEGSCTGHAGTSGGEWIYRRYLNKQPIFSPQYTYVKELIAQGSFPDDVGSDGLTLCKVIVNNGFCESSAFPYTPDTIIAPTPEQDTNAGWWRLVEAYHGLTGSQTALSVLGDPTPWPIAIGFTVYASFESDLVAGSGIVPLPKPNEQILGGHETLIVGFDIEDTPVLRPETCPPAVLVQNSWGTSWGINGFFWMPLEYLDAGDTDLKVFHSGKPW